MHAIQSFGRDLMSLCLRPGVYVLGRVDKTHSLRLRDGQALQKLNAMVSWSSRHVACDDKDAHFENLSEGE